MPYQGRHVTVGDLRKHWSLGVWFLIILFSLFLMAFSVIGGTLWYFSRDLPSIEALREYQPSLVTKVYGEGDEFIGQFFVERRILVPFERIPNILRNAIISVEDSRFYEHRGVDPLGILRAFMANVGSMSLRQGGSTITQQLARSLFLSPEKSFKIKIREANLAWKMERFLSKDEILELYLTQIYLGHGAYGVQAAARTYFDKDVSELDLAEVAFIAGLPRAPTDYSPYRNPGRTKRRQGVVLRRMVLEGYISEDDFEKVYQKDLYFKKPRKKELVAPYFLEYVRQYLASRYGDAMVYKGGLKVDTTINPTLQKAAKIALEEGLRKVDKRQGYRGPIDQRSLEEVEELIEQVGDLIITDVEPGTILEGIVTGIDEAGASIIASGMMGRIKPSGMVWAKKRLLGPDTIKDVRKNPKAKPEDILSVGDVIHVKLERIESKSQRAIFSLEQEPIVEGALISLDPRTGAIKAMVGGFDFKRSQFNRAISAKRQPGSAFKPIIYAAALDRGRTPATILIDAPIVYFDEEQDRVWKPENYESRFYGPVTLREALIHSRNLATVRLMDEIGVNNVIDFSRRLGIRSPLALDLSLALGSSSLSLLELTSAYGVFANEGVRAEPNAVLAVLDSKGEILEEHLPVVTSVIRPETAYLISNILMDVIQEGTGRRAKVLEKPMGGKTGTTNNFTDAWFVGFLPNLAVGVWVGFDDMRSIGKHEAGARAALPIWISYMKTAIEVLPDATFSIPDDVTFARIDPKTGALASEETVEPVIEIFAKGTEPQEVAHLSPKPADFFRIDSAVDF